MKFVIYRSETAVGFDVIQIFFNESDRFIERYIKDVMIGGGKYYMLWNVDFVKKIIIDRDIKSALLNIKHEDKAIREICTCVALSKGEYEIHEKKDPSS